MKQWNNMGAATRLRLLVIPFLVLSGIIPTIWGFAQNPDWGALALNFGTEMLSTLITFVLIDLLLGSWERREEQSRQSTEQRQRLILQMRSKNNGIALQALEELRSKGWLTGTTLRTADLYRANLEGANLTEIDLEGATLREAMLQGAYMRGVNLTGASLNRANLISAVLRDANLTNADLSETDLERADLRDSNLENTQLDSANLAGADLRGASLRYTSFVSANLERAGFSRATIIGADFTRANLTGAKSLTDDLLRTAHSLTGATLPDGTPYDKRFNLPADQ